MGKFKDIAIANSQALPDIQLKSKKEVINKAKETAKNIIESGEFDLTETIANTLRLEEYLKEFNKELKEVLKTKISEKYKAFGLEMQIVNGASRLNYKEDDEWVRIKKELTDRENLLKLASKSDKPIYDSDGAEIPRVSTTGGKETIKIIW